MKEIERLIAKLQLDKEILANEEAKEQEAHLMAQFFINTEADRRRCDGSRDSRQPITISGLDQRGKIAAFTGVVQSVESGVERFPGYPWRVTIIEE